MEEKNIYPIYKPKGPTSHDIVDSIRKITGIKKIGHAGTLDPLASGVLVVGIGREATKKLSEISGKEKEYIAEIYFGYVSNTDDSEGNKTEDKIEELPSKKEIIDIISGLRRDYMQIPPLYSSIKISGVPAHRRVRRGQEIKIKPRKVFLKDFKVINFLWPVLKIRILVGSGFYVRSFARDLGKRLRGGAYLLSLERIRVGNFNLNNSLTISEFKYEFQKNN